MMFGLILLMFRVPPIRNPKLWEKFWFPFGILYHLSAYIEMLVGNGNLAAGGCRPTAVHARRMRLRRVQIIVVRLAFPEAKYA